MQICENGFALAKFFIKNKRMVFNYKYFIISIIIFVVEVIIATLLKGNFFIRAYLGDVLVVMLIYTFILSFFRVKSKLWLIFSIFIFAVSVELAQYFKVADKLGFKPNSIPHIVIGNTFSAEDILCYGAGCLVLLCFHFLERKKPS